jgi:hypothetical protein
MSVEEQKFNDSKMKNKKTQEDEEKDIFKVFAKTVNENFNISINTGSIENCEPPDPDIKCGLNGEEIYFELTEAIDGNLKKSNDWQQELRKEINASLGNDCGICKKYSNALITMSPCKGFRAKPKFLSELIGVLNSLEYGFTGDVPARLSGIQRINITRGPFNCSLDLSVLTWFESKIENSIKMKFEKYPGSRYSEKKKVELLIYYGSWIGNVEDVYLRKVGEYIKNNLDSTCFKRVWIFQYPPGAVIYVFPGCGARK